MTGTQRTGALDYILYPCRTHYFYMINNTSILAHDSATPRHICQYMTAVVPVLGTKSMTREHQPLWRTHAKGTKS